MKLSSPDFNDRSHMPEKIGYKKQNINPNFVIEGVPGNAESLVLLMDDPDAMEPAGKVWDHWTVWNIDPNTGRIEQGDSPGVEGKNDYGEQGYGGPHPPDKTHTYRFRLYALDTELDLPVDAKKNEVEKEIEGHVIEEAELEGKYDPI